MKNLILIPVIGLMFIACEKEVIESNPIETTNAQQSLNNNSPNENTKSQQNNIAQKFSTAHYNAIATYEDMSEQEQNILSGILDNQQLTEAQKKQMIFADIKFKTHFKAVKKLQKLYIAHTQFLSIANNRIQMSTLLANDLNLPPAQGSGLNCEGEYDACLESALTTPYCWYNPLYCYTACYLDYRICRAIDNFTK